MRIRQFTVVLFAFALLPGKIIAETLILNPVPRNTIEARLAEYGGNDQQREKMLLHLFAESGCDENHLSEQIVKGSKLRNIICSLPGTSGKSIIVGAHFDHVSEGDGVVDNWSGASLLPSLYQALREKPRKHTYLFIGFASEEVGEVGSRFYVGEMTKDQVKETDAMVNIDTLGLSPSKVWASRADSRLISLLAYIAKLINLPISAVNVEKVGSTDSEQFSARKIPSITIHSLTQEDWNAHILHTSRDRISAIHLDDYYNSYHLLAAYLALLDEFSSETKPTPAPK